jgi:hypothetical protein
LSNTFVSSICWTNETLFYRVQGDILETEINTAARVAKLFFECKIGASGSTERHDGVHPRLQARLRDAGLRRGRKHASTKLPQGSDSASICTDVRQQSVDGVQAVRLQVLAQ